MKTAVKTESRTRYYFIDEIRGFSVINMVLYHAIWDLVSIFGIHIRWYDGKIGYIWQQCICWLFIFISGFCFSFGKKKLKRGLTVFICGAAISLVTLIAMPEEKIIFGVLTCLGSCSLISIPLEKWFNKVNAFLGLALSAILFFIFRNINIGYFGFENLNIAKVPDWLYRNYFTCFLGFPQAGFTSSDYFSLFPWLFLFFIGYFFCRALRERNGLKVFAEKRIPFLGFLGRHSLEIYMVHQPMIYAVLYSFFKLAGRV